LTDDGWGKSKKTSKKKAKVVFAKSKTSLSVRQGERHTWGGANREKTGQPARRQGILVTFPHVVKTSQIRGS